MDVVVDVDVIADTNLIDCCIIVKSSGSMSDKSIISVSSMWVCVCVVVDVHVVVLVIVDVVERNVRARCLDVWCLCMGCLIVIGTEIKVRYLSQYGFFRANHMA